MTLKVIGPRVLLEPVTPTPSSVIELTDRLIPTAGKVISVGRPSCVHCGGEEAPALEAGDIAIVAPTEGQSVTVDRKEYWIVPYRAILGTWTGETHGG